MNKIDYILGRTDMVEALRIIARGRDDNGRALHGETSRLLARATLRASNIEWEKTNA